METVLLVVMLLVLSTFLTREYVNCKDSEEATCSTLIIIFIIEFIFLVKRVPEFNIGYSGYSSVVAATFLFITLNLLVWATVISWIAQKKGGYSKLKNPDEEGIINSLSSRLMRFFVWGFMLAIVFRLIALPGAELISFILLGLTAALLGGLFLGLAEGYPAEFKDTTNRRGGRTYAKA